MECLPRHDKMKARITFPEFGKIWNELSVEKRRSLIREIHFYDEKDIEILADGTWKQLSELQYNLASTLFEIYRRKQYLPY